MGSLSSLLTLLVTLVAVSCEELRESKPTFAT